MLRFCNFKMAQHLQTFRYDLNKLRRSNSCPTGLSSSPSPPWNPGRRYLTGDGEIGGVCVAYDEVKSFVRRAMEAVGTRPGHAASLADNLAMADYRGHFSHGLNRLEIYTNDMLAGITERDAEPEILKEGPSTALVDGRNLLGTVVGTFCMEVAIRKAGETGIGFVVARRSNHYGIAGFYSTMASDRGLLGLSFTNTSPIVFPTRGREATLGTNALSVAAPGRGGDSFVLDMATSSVAYGKVELAAIKGEKIPLGWGANKRGKVTADPHEVLDGGGLLPLGGGEVTGGYKGYGLAAAVEIFCGILSGSQFGPKIRRWKDTGRIADLGQCFMAIDPGSFEAGFEGRMQEMMDLCRGSARAEGETEILVAGDPERKHMEECDKRGGITYHPNVISLMDSMSDSLKIKRIARLP